MKRLLLSLCLLTSIVSQAQKALWGKLLSADNNQPIPNASVYLSNTSIGVMSKEDGSFSINPFPEGRYDLVVSRVGYITYSQTINAATLPNELVITLKPKVVNLEEVVVAPFIKDGWKEWGDFFMEHLIGKTPNAEKCKLLNKEVVRFRLKKNPGRLEAVASEPLIIENKALGYTLTYDLGLFEYQLNAGLCTYQGYPLFTEMEAPNTETAEKWQRNREEAYRGSIMHFMRSLYRNQLQEEGFELKHVLRRKRKLKNGFFERLPAMLINVPLTGDSIAYSIDSATVQLLFNDYLQVTYPDKKTPKSYINYLSSRQQNPFEGINGMPFSDLYKLPSEKPSTKQPITSELTSPNTGEGVQVLYNGHYYFSPNLIAMQYWAWSEKLSNLLPLDYGNPQPSNAEINYKPQ